jgi:hypothetical protein
LLFWERVMINVLSLYCSIGFKPQGELTQIDSIRVHHGRQEIVTSHCRSIVTLKVQIHALSKAFFCQQGLIHSNDFSSLAVNGGGGNKYETNKKRRPGNKQYSSRHKQVESSRVESNGMIRTATFLLWCKQISASSSWQK